MRKTLIIIFVLFLVLIAVPYAIGASIPENHSIARKVTFSLPKEKIWKTIYDNENMPSWNENLESVEKISDNAIGGEIWKFNDTSGNYMTVRNYEVIENEKLASRIIETDLPFGGDWIFELQENNGSTNLILTEHGNIKNPLFRFITHYIVGYDMGVNQFLIAVKRKLKNSSPIEEIKLENNAQQ